MGYHQVPVQRAREFRKKRQQEVREAIERVEQAQREEADERQRVRTVEEEMSAQRLRVQLRARGVEVGGLDMEAWSEMMDEREGLSLRAPRSMALRITTHNAGPVGTLHSG